MKRCMPLLAVVACLLSPRPCPGQAAPGSIEIGAGAGRFYGGRLGDAETAPFGKKVRADDDILKSFWLGAQLSRDWGLELSVRRTKTHLLAEGEGVFPNEPALAGLDFATIELSGLRCFRLGNLLPYVGVGLGVANTDPDTPNPAVRDSNHFCASLSGGARFYAARWVGLRADVRGRFTYLGSHPSGQGGGWLRNPEILVGAFLSFGGK